MKKSTILKLVVALAVVILFFSLIGCERIDAGHVGIKVKLTGSERGVQDITEVTGWVFYMPMLSSIYEFPTFVQHKEYTEITINSKDGSTFTVTPLLNYSIRPDKVPHVFRTYRRPLEEIESGFIKTAIYDAFRMSANKFTADSLISNRENFERAVRLTLEKQIIGEGFNISQFTSNLTYPPTFMNAINSKNAAVQKALQIENEVKQTEAQAKIKIVQTEAAARVRIIQANAYAEATVKEAKADAESNKLSRESLSPALIQWQLAIKWNGVLPQYSAAPALFKDISK
jgi:regulator of protease activity HflC (stomatin/prohibitin superfamily)